MLTNYKSIADKALDENEALGDKRDLAKKLARRVPGRRREDRRNEEDRRRHVDHPRRRAGDHRRRPHRRGEKLESTLKKLVKELSADEPKLKEMIKLDAEKYEGVNFSVATLPVPDPKAQEFSAKRSRS